MRRLALVVAIVGAVLAADQSDAASTAFPRIVIVSGSELRRPVVISDWEQISRFVTRVTAAPIVRRAELANRPRLTLSLFWGPRWIDYLDAGRSPDALRPSQADQHGSYYPAWRDRAAAIELPWAGRWPRVVSSEAVRILVRFGVPGRVVEPVDPWAALRRPLTLPRLSDGASCPLSEVNTTVDWNTADVLGGTGIGPGPVYPALGAEPLLDVKPDTQYGGVWHGQKVFWYVLPSYAGPVLIRGRRLDGHEWMRFDGGKAPMAELHIGEGETVFWNGRPPGSRGWPSSVRVRAAGCYGVQIDGTTFSRTVVFRVTLSG